MEDIQSYNIEIQDINGDFIAEFKDIKPSKISSRIVVADGKYVKNNIISFKCIVQNAIKNDSTLPESIEEISNNVEE